VEDNKAEAIKEKGRTKFKVMVADMNHLVTVDIIRERNTDGTNGIPETPSHMETLCTSYINGEDCGISSEIRLTNMSSDHSGENFDDRRSKKRKRCEFLLLNPIQRFISAIILAPAVTCFVWLSPVFATTTVCGIVVSACIYEYSWIQYRIQFRFLTPIRYGGSAIPGGSIERFNAFFLTQDNHSNGERNEFMQQHEDIRSMLNLKKRAITTIAIKYFHGKEWLAAMILAVPTTILCSTIFILGLMTIPTMSDTEFYAFRWLYALLTDYVTSLFAFYTPSWKHALVAFVEKKIFDVLTVHSTMCPMNQLDCGIWVDSIEMFAGGVLFFIIFHCSFRRNPVETFLLLLLDVLGFVYIVGTLSVIVAFVDDERSTMYRNLLIALLYVVWAADTAAYLVGKILEFLKYPYYHPLAPHLSKSKDYEGTFAAILFGIAAMLASSDILDVPGALHVKIVITIVAVIVGRMGDLFQSLLKRTAGIKHSGKLIPGHGGVLDRIDALMFASLVFSRYYSEIST
jgi:CDP-diglyceride synthetase